MADVRLVFSGTPVPTPGPVPLVFGESDQPAPSIPGRRHAVRRGAGHWFAPAHWHPHWRAGAIGGPGHGPASARVAAISYCGQHRSARHGLAPAHCCGVRRPACSAPPWAKRAVCSRAPWLCRPAPPAATAARPSNPLPGARTGKTLPGPLPVRARAGKTTSWRAWPWSSHTSEPSACRCSRWCSATSRPRPCLDTVVSTMQQAQRVPVQPVGAAISASRCSVHAPAPARFPAGPATRRGIATHGLRTGAAKALGWPVPASHAPTAWPVGTARATGANPVLRANAACAAAFLTTTPPSCLRACFLPARGRAPARSQARRSLFPFGGFTSCSTPSR